ncbi:MAG: T9SS type A sorting domain-containing protein [Brevinematia bacterium]
MKKFLLIILLLFIIPSLGFGGYWYKTISNTIVWEEIFSDAFHLDAYNSYIGWWVGGLRNLGFVLWAWDGPVVDVVVDKVNSRVYSVGELDVHSRLSGSVFIDNANFRYDVYVHKLTTGGSKSWPLSVRARKNTNESLLSFDNGGSRYPSACLDDSGNLYVVYSDFINSSWRLVAQKVSSSGNLLWGSLVSDVIITNAVNYQAKPVYYGGYVFVAYYIGNNIRLAKLNSSDGSIVFNVQVNTSLGSNYYPDIVVGPDGYLYVVWLNNSSGNYNVLAQRINPANGSKVSWGGSTTDKTVNAYTSYSSANYWYGASEETISIDVDGYDLYVAFKLYRDAKSKVFLQKINFSGGNFTRVWSDDVMVGRGTDLGQYRADAYPDIVVLGNSVFVVWINHGPTENDQAFLQRVDKTTGQVLWNRDINLYSRANVYHHARIATDGAFLYVISANPYRSIVKLDQFGNVIWNVNLLDTDRMYNNYATFRTKNLILPDAITGFVPIAARVNSIFSGNSISSYAYFYLSPETNFSGASTNYIILTNGQNSNFSYQKGNVFMYIILDNVSNEGTNRIVITNLKVEFTDYYFSDAMVGKLPSGDDKRGINVIRDVNTYQSVQMVDEYVYNDGVNSAKGFFFFINNGTVATNIRIKADTGNANWSVKYFICTNNGSEWVTNQEITSLLTNTGFQTNLPPYAGGNSNIVVIRVFLTPSISLSSGDNFVVKGYAYTQLPSGDWVQSDVVGFRGIVSAARPDLYISKDNVNYNGIDVINSDANGQTIELRMNVGVEKVGYFKLRNTGGGDNIKIQGTGGDGFWKVQYLTNGIDITSSIENGTFSVYLNSGQEFGPFEVRFAPTNSSIPINVSKNILIKASSQSDPTKEDVIKFVIRPVVTKVEIVARKYNDSTWIGRNVFSQDYSQNISNRIDNGITNVYEISITNLGSYYEDITLKASNRNFVSGWEVEYLFDNNYITSIITNTGFVISNLSPSNQGSNIIVRVISPLSYPTGANEVMGIFFEGIGDSDTNNISKRDTFAIYDKLVSTKVDGIVYSSVYGVGGYNIIGSDPLSQYLYTYTFSNDTYTIILSNPSPSDFEFLVKVTNANNIQWKISVSNGSADITSLITNDYWITPSITSGSTYSLTLYVSSTNEDNGLGANVGDTNKVFILVRSPLKDSVVDNLSVFVEKSLPPDVVVKNTNESLYRGFNTFSANPNSANQVVYNSYPNGDTTYKEGLFRIKNLRPIPEDVLIKVSEVQKDNEWDYKIYRYVGSNVDNPDFSNPSDWSEITVDITNVGITNSITNGSDVLYRISSKPISATNNNDKIILNLTAKGLSTKWSDVGQYSVSYGIGIPDLFSQDGAGRNVLNDSYNTKITNIFDKALGDVITLNVSNINSDISGVFLIKGDGNKGQWVIKYYSQDTNEITSSVVSSSGYSISVLPLSNYSFYVKVYAVAGSTYGFGEITNFDISVENDQGNKDTIRLFSVITDRGIPDVYASSAWSNVFESSPSSQILTSYIGKGDSITNYFSIANWRNALETNELYITSPMVSDFSIKVEKFSNSSWIDITSEVTNSGTKHTLALTTNSVNVRVIISVDSNTSLPLNTTEDIDISLTSQGKLKVDKGRFRYILTDMGRPDVFYISGSITNGKNIYETSPSIQVQDVEIEKNVTNEIDLTLQNDRNKDENMKIWTSNHPYSEFKLSYFVSTNGVDWVNITQHLTNTNEYIIPVIANSNVLFKVQSLLSLLSTNDINDMLEVNFKLYSYVGVSNDNFKLRYVVKDKNRPDLFTQTAGSNTFYPIPQRVTNLIEKGSTITQEIVIMNAKNDRTSDFILEGNSGSGDWNISYILDGVDITSSVTDTGYVLSSIPPLGTKTLQIIASLDQNSMSTFESNFIVNLNLFSYTKLVKDVFQVIYKVNDLGRPDIFFISSQDGVYYPDIQEVTNKIEKAEYITNYFYVQNDRVDRAEDLTLKGSFVGGTNWVYEVDVFDSISWVSIVNLFTNNGFVTNLPYNTTLTGRVITFVSNSIDVISSSLGMVNFDVLSQGKLVKDSGTMKFVVVDPKPDLMALPVSSGGNLVGSDLYETSSNVTTNSIAVGYVMVVLPSIYSLFVQNDDFVEDTFIVKVYGDLSVSNKWDVSIKDQNDVDLTYQFINGITNTVSATNQSIYQVEVKLVNATNVSIGESNVIWFKVYSLKNTNKVDFVKIITKRIESDVRGIVIEKVSGNPIEGAKVQVFEGRSGNLLKEVFTSNDGKFGIKLIPTTYRFLVSKDKYILFEKVVTIPEVLEYDLESFALLKYNLKEDVFDAHSFPNPVNSGGNVKLLINIPQRSQVKAYIVDIKGVVLKRFVNDEIMEKGQYSFDWNLRKEDGTILKQGVYLFVVNDGRETIIKRIMIK